MAPFGDPRVAAVGGRVDPAWPDRRPDWFPRHLDWTVGCTNPGLPDEVVEIRNVFGASAAFRRAALERVGGFPVELGRVGADVAGCEETHVCIRIRQTADETVVFAPRSLVRHRVTPGRTRVSYVLRRCFGEGRSKARLGAMVGAGQATADEREYSRAIARAVSHDVAGSFREPRRLKRAAILSAGLLSAAAGYRHPTRRDGASMAVTVAVEPSPRVSTPRTVMPCPAPSTDAAFWLAVAGSVLLALASSGTLAGLVLGLALVVHPGILVSGCSVPSIASNGWSPSWRSVSCRGSSSPTWP